MEIVSRAASGLRPPTKLIYTTWGQRDEVVFHYSGGPASQSWKSIQDWCMDEPPNGKGHSDIDYNGGIDMRTGRLYEGRTGIWLSIGSHNLNRNTRGIGLCFIGDANTPLSEAAKATGRWCFDEANRLRHAAGFGALNPRVHSDHQPTSCPGGTIRAWVNGGMQAGAPLPGGVFTLYANYGDNNEAVKEMQLDLIRAGFSVGSSGADSDYGPATARGVAAMVGTGDGMRYQADERAVLQDLLRRGAGGGVSADQVKAMIAGTTLSPA